MKTSTVEESRAITPDEEQLRVLEQIPADFRGAYAAEFARVLSIPLEAPQNEEDTLETDSQASGNTTSNDPETVVRLYLSRHKGILISPTSEHQTAVLGGERVDANVAKAVSLKEVGRMPLRFAMEA